MTWHLLRAHRPHHEMHLMYLVVHWDHDMCREWIYRLHVRTWNMPHRHRSMRGKIGRLCLVIKVLSYSNKRLKRMT